MRRMTQIALLSVVLGVDRPAQAQTQQGWDVAVYPVLAWIPTGIEIDVTVPPFDGGSGGTGDIVDGRFDGAFLGGVAASNGRWRIDADIMWAAVGGDRLELPHLTVDADIIYAHGMVGFAVAPDFYVTGGFRRFALKYDVKLGDLPDFSREPGVWDPLVGVGWHRVRRAFEVHATFEGGGFGAGADVDLGGGLRVDWKPIPHFGITAGYGFLYFKVTNDLAGRVFTVKQTLHGPVAGIGFYF